MQKAPGEITREMRLIPSLLPLLLTSFSYLQKQRGSDTLEPGETFPGSASRPAGLGVPDEGHVPFQPRSPEAPAGRMLFHRLGNRSVPPAFRFNHSHPVGTRGARPECTEFFQPGPDPK